MTTTRNSEDTQLGLRPLTDSERALIRAMILHAQELEPYDGSSPLSPEDRERLAAKLDGLQTWEPSSSDDLDGLYLYFTSLDEEDEAVGEEHYLGAVTKEFDAEVSLRINANLDISDLEVGPLFSPEPRRNLPSPEELDFSARDYIDILLPEGMSRSEFIQKLEAETRDGQWKEILNS